MYVNGVDRVVHFEGLRWRGYYSLRDEDCENKLLVCVGAGGCCCVRAYLSSMHRNMLCVL